MTPNQKRSMRGYNVYIATLTQSGTSAPTVSIIENTLGAEPVWTYGAVGSYVCTLSGAFTVGKTLINPPNNWNSPAIGGDDVAYGCGSDDVNSCYLSSSTIVRSTGVVSFANDTLSGSGYSVIEIRVYD